MFTLWFMGLPASGKSTLARRTESLLAERGYDIENLDGDELRKNLHPDLGFTREDRRTNNRRTAFVSKLLNRNGIPVIVAMITPFRESQQQAREIIETEGEFVLVYVKCPLEVCERRDPKGLYERAREGKIENFTGISHPFQDPVDPEIVVDTSQVDPDRGAAIVVERLEELGILDERLDETYGFGITRSEEQSIKDRLQELGHIEDET